MNALHIPDRCVILRQHYYYGKKINIFTLVSKWVYEVLALRVRENVIKIRQMKMSDTDQGVSYTAKFVLTHEFHS